MASVSRYKVENSILIPIIILSIISIVTIYIAQGLLPTPVNDLAIRQAVWYVLGFIVAYIILAIGNEFIYKNVWFLYGFCVLALIGLFFFAPSINGSRCWYVIPSIGSIQPSEFMKIILILTLAKVIHNFNEANNNPSVKDEFKFILKVLAIVMIPSVITFMQPDTGSVLIYLIITLVMLLISGIRFRWFLILFGIILLFGGIFLFIYFVEQELFIKLFGTSFFYRIDRIINWNSGSGMQLSNALMAIGSGGIFGNGFNNNPIYFPEPTTDFIFAVFASNFGLIGSSLLILLLIFFNMRLISLAVKNSNNISRYVIAGILGMLIYQQIQNIGMTIGLLPITGITLPFISYGGSSLLSYMIMAGIIFSISNESLRFTNTKNTYYK